MDDHTKLLLIPCSGEETAKLAEEICRILKKDYHLEEHVEILRSERRENIAPETPKNYRSPLIGDFFPDEEAQADIGLNYLKDVVRGRHVVLVEHLLTPNRKVSKGSRQTVSVNDHIMLVRGYLDVISNVDTLQRTLVAPYLSYVRSHSVEKYRTGGFVQFDSLRKTLKDYKKDGLDALLTVDPHSDKAGQIAGELGVDFHGVNPFHSGRSINPYKLGLDGERSKEVMKRLRPFQERFAQLKKTSPEHLYVISVDDGTERRAENFTDRAFPELPPEEVYRRLLYFDKERTTYETSLAKFKHFSQIKEGNIDQEGTYVIIDDMFASGGTVNKVGRILKERGGKRVEVWTTHAVTVPTQQEKANNREYIDKVVCLDTVPQSPSLEIEYIKASADLLSAELYKTHQRLIASR